MKRLRLVPFATLLVACSASPMSVVAEMPATSPPTSVATSTTSTEPTTTTTRATTTTVRATTTTLDMEDIYLTVVKGSVKGTYSNYQLLSLGHTVCEGIDEIGASAELRALVQATVQTGFDAGDAGVIAGAAVAAFCPEHSAALQAAADRYSR